MRKHFSNYIENVADKYDDLVFVTGDLGYNALENLRDKLGNRFINAGVAEQNMIGMAAGMAYRGYRVVCYSIAPFVVYRCLEQMRNDVCFHELPVFIAGNGGGYHYGALGSSHHALEDLAVLSGLPNMKCYVPAFLDDMNTCMDEMFDRRLPAYLRLGVGKPMPAGFDSTAYGAARTVANAQLTVVAQSPIINNVLQALQNDGLDGVTDVFVVNRMPLADLPTDIARSLSACKKLLTVEEHVAVGGLGASVAYQAAAQGIKVEKYVSVCAHGYPNGLYGNQTYHHEVTGMDIAGLSRTLHTFFGNA